MATRQQPMRRLPRCLSRLGLPRPLSPGQESAIRHARIWGLNVLITAGAIALVRLAIGLGGDEPGFRIHWLILALGFYIAEVAVVHLEFNQDAHSFSMSEIPLLIGLFYAGSMDLVLAMLLGSAAALILHRRQSAAKLTFNLGQFAVQVSIALIFFRLIGSGSRGFGLVTAVGAVAGILVATMVAQVLVGLAIYATGGRETEEERREVLGLSAAASIMNAIMALGGVVIVSAAPRASWLAVMPPVFLYLAYRAYVGQRAERARMSALFEATRNLLRAPVLEEVLVTAGLEAQRMVKAEKIQIVLFGDEDRDLHYVTTVDSAGVEGILTPRTIEMGRTPWPSVSNRRDPRLFSGQGAAFLDLDGAIPIREAAVAPLLVSQVPVGLMIALNRVGDIASFRESDGRLLATFASQVGVCLENGKLSEALGEMQKTQGQLELLVAAKDQLIASVSHELRTPLTGVVGLARALERDVIRMAASETSDLARMIADQGTELSYIVEDLLVQARADGGTLAVRPERVDLDREITAVVSTLVSTTGVAVDAPVSGVWAWADSLRLRQILRNLVTNSVRYGGPRVWIEVVEIGGGVRISVCDDGDGVPPGMESVIFEPYSSAHDHPASVGLGLAVSRKIARLMGGDLAYRRQGEHTAFDLLVRPVPA